MIRFKEIIPVTAKEEKLQITRKIEGLKSWEPVINSRISREYFEYDFIANYGDYCDECGNQDLENSLVVSDGKACFCSWECLITRAQEYPDSYNIQSLGIYDPKFKKGK